MSRGIWATWYDLDADDRADFTAWEQSHYLPALAADKRFNWVARYASKSGIGVETGVFGETVIDGAKEGVGTATQYLVLIGADSPHVFLDPLVLDGEEASVAGAADMVAKRRHVRHAIFLNEETAEGPETPGDGGPDVPAPAVRLGVFNMRTPAEDFDAGRWYAQRRLRELGQSPGCVRTRKLMCVAGWGKHGILYEFVSPQARADLWEYFKKQKATTPEAFWTIGPQTLHAPGSPFLGERTWSSV